MFNQTQEQVEMMKEEDDSKSYDENFVNNATQHSVTASVLTRKAKGLTEDKLNEYI